MRLVKTETEVIRCLSTGHFSVQYTRFVSTINTVRNSVFMTIPFMLRKAFR